MASSAARERYARKNEAEDLKRAFQIIDKKKDGKIDTDELNYIFSNLGHETKRGEVDDMIWEVDEDCDGTVKWKEFKNMYNRCKNDTIGQEPRRLFNVVEFLINDKNGNGRITLEGAMQIMYLRYGRALLDTRLEEIFGTCDINSGKTLSLTEFLTSLHACQIKQLNSKLSSPKYKTST